MISSWTMPPGVSRGIGKLPRSTFASARAPPRWSLRGERADEVEEARAGFAGHFGPAVDRGAELPPGDARGERRVRAVGEAALFAQDVEEARGGAAAERLVRDDGRGEERVPARERGPREEEVRLHGARAVHEVDREARRRRGGGGTAGAGAPEPAGRPPNARAAARRSTSGSAAPARTSVAPANEKRRGAKSATSSRVSATRPFSVAVSRPYGWPG